MSARPRIAFVAGGLAAEELARIGVIQRELDVELIVLPLEQAVGMVRAGQADAVAGELGARPDDLLALAKATGASPSSLRVALVRGTRVVVLAPALDADSALATLELAALALARDLGVSRPRLAVCALEPEEPEQGAPGLARACARARAAGLDVTGPSPAEEALQASGADAVVTLTRDQARLALVLGGSGAVARLVLGLGFIRTSEDTLAARKGGDAREASLRASVALAARVARARGALVADREKQAADSRRTVVAVTPRPTPDLDRRCPYCRRGFASPWAAESDSDEPAVLCAKCETPHHRACIHEHGRCTVHGCGSDSVKAHGREVRIDRLAGEGIVRHPFQAVLGPEPSGEGLRWLKVDSPIDDPDERAPRREVSLVLVASDVPRGGVIEGTLVVRSPRALRASGAVLRVRSALEVRPLEPDARPTHTPILDREALVFGRLPEGVLGRLSSGLAALLGSGDHVSIPAGVRRYPFALRLASDHPASVRLSSPRGLEAVTTTVSVVLALAGGGSLPAEVPVVVA